MNVRDYTYQNIPFFNHGGAVPAHMSWTKLSETACPSNVVLLKAQTIDDALVQAFARLRTGVQAAVWMMGAKLGDGNALSAKAYDEALAHHRTERVCALKAKFNSVNYVDRPECESSFRPHIDGVASGGDMLDEYRGVIAEKVAHMLPIQIVENHKGRGILLFGKNPILAREYIETKKIENPSMLGSAFMVPTGSVTFMAKRSWGVERACLHSPAGEVARSDKQIVRELSVYECRGFNK